MIVGIRLFVWIVSGFGYRFDRKAGLGQSGDRVGRSGKAWCSWTGECKAPPHLEGACVANDSTVPIWPRPLLSQAALLLVPAPPTNLPAHNVLFSFLIIVSLKRLQFRPTLVI